MHKFIATVHAISALVLICPGCGDQLEPGEDDVDSMPVKAVSEYPLTRRMLLGEFQAQVKPLISIPVSASVDGDIRFHVSKTRVMLQQDVLWGEIGADQIASEERELQLKTHSEKLRLQEELQNVERERVQVEYMLADPALWELPFEDRIPVSTNLVQQLRNEHRLLQEQLASCGEAERLALEQKNLRSRLVMPFDGELLLFLPVSPGRKTFRVAANTPIGVMRDISEIYLHIIVRDPQIVGIPPGQLCVEYKRDSGVVFSGRFHDAQVTELQKQDVLIYRFAFAAEHTAELTALIGANLTCGLWVESAEPFHAVPKIDVALMLTGKTPFSGWRESIHALWPSARMLYSGRSHLGIALEDAAE